MSGGMWGGTRDAVPDMMGMVKSAKVDARYVADMNFLNKVIWPIAIRHVAEASSCCSVLIGYGCVSVCTSKYE